MKRLPGLAPLFLLLLAACSQTPALWGAYPTPTANGSLTPLTPLGADSPGPAATPQAVTPTASPSPAPPLATATLSAPRTPRLELTYTPTLEGPPLLYYSQSGDTLGALAARFGVESSEIHSSTALPETGLITPGTLLIIPDRLEQTTPAVQIMPDSEVVFSATAVDFDIQAYVMEADGYLADYDEWLGSTGWATGAGIIERLAYENSVNPRLLLAVLEYESNWVRGRPADLLHSEYPMGYINLRDKGLYGQMAWAIRQLSIGYYGWRSGALTELTFNDGTRIRLSPDLNAGSSAIQYLFAQRHSPNEWARIIDPEGGFPAFYAQMFGDPWERAAVVEPILPPGLTQPALVLPFEPNREWAYTGGPHQAWERDGPLAALDFAPATDVSGCTESEKWIVASAPGLVVRSSNGVVVLDLDGDGREQTGWSLMYLHVDSVDRVPLGAWVETDDRIGHASCEGGVSTGTHLHFARKYNGEWILADGPLPFVLSGWVAHAGEKPYEGTLTKGDKVIIADPVGTAKSVIFRQADE